MSDKPRVIKANFSNWRVVQGRKCLQLIFEVPLEMQTEVLTMLGTPGISEDKWCAIALLNEPRAAQGGISAVANQAETPRETNKPRRRFEELPVSQQCALRCEDEEFVNFFDVTIDRRLDETIEQAVRRYCGVISRAEFSTNADALKRWSALDAQYRQWQTDQRYADVRR